MRTTSGKLIISAAALAFAAVLIFPALAAAQEAFREASKAGKTAPAR
jgi:hypothetical protein